MLTNRDDVLAILRGARKKPLNFFIPLGGYDDKTQAKKDISNLTGTLYNHLPLSRAIVDAAVELPFYVGYDGNSPDTRSSSYTSNLILLHEEADESTLAFIQGYVHELVHLDQDRRGLLREYEAVPAIPYMVDFLAHNLMLEAAAFAVEAISLYYLSEYSALVEVEDEVQDYFDDYADSLPGNIFMRDIIEESLDGKVFKGFQSLKPAFQAVFQSFFAPDSAHMGNYLKQFSEVYLNARLDPQTTRINRTVADRDWGGEKALRDITTITGWGRMFPQGAMPVLLRQIRAAILQEKYLPMIDLVRGHVLRQEQGNDPLAQFSFKPAP